ncbi:rhamnulose-1-phosphate aldolase [Draconibacterium sp. IB214405]|uniref:rhamnulose-1-phosphate aldolase n=1 Tax=Draconibacterium sp. IB214405 TaxID=3097352 RepID=UPI002A11F50D|nr:rhamnulose-1-phosphate aldolase [Draconibacterium sp. IB214405]MDX8338900.1 rhamnulose-1-phosphate aldolase [Draconibacterium sp. IB214405]
MVTYKKLPGEVLAHLESVAEIAGYLWNKEWIEKSSGNISIDFTGLFSATALKAVGEEFPYEFPKEAAGKILFVTGSGCHLRHLVYKAEEVSAIIFINETATAYSILWGGKKAGFKPTSELRAHLKIHLFNEVNNTGRKAVVHAHPTELVVLSHHKLFKDEAAFNHALWKMCPEIKLYVPHGISCTNYARYGTETLADLTLAGLKTNDVVLWEKHGALATGADLEEAFDYLDVANKGARLLLLAWSSGFDPEGLSPEQLDEISRSL